MDYFSALLFVMCSCYVSIVKLYYCHFRHVETKMHVCLSIAVAMIAFYLYHVNYLLFLNQFDYQYNMRINLLFGKSRQILASSGLPNLKGQLNI